MTNRIPRRIVEGGGLFFICKGTVSVILSDSSCKDVNARFRRFVWSCSLLFFHQSDFCIFTAGKHLGILYEIHTCKPSKMMIFKGTFVNRKLPFLSGGSLKHVQSL